MRIGKTTNPKDAGSVIARVVMSGNPLKIRAIGAGAVNQASKACAIAGGYTAQNGVHLTFILGFDDVPSLDSDKDITAMTWQPVPRRF